MDKELEPPENTIVKQLEDRQKPFPGQLPWEAEVTDVS